MALSIKHPDLPFTVNGNQVRYPNGNTEPLTQENMMLVQIVLLNELVSQQKQANEKLEPPIATQPTKAKQY